MPFSHPMKTESVPKPMTLRLTSEDVIEAGHKLGILQDEPELATDYGLTAIEAKILRESLPRGGGEWNVPVWAMKAVAGEFEDHATVLRAIAHDARRGGEVGQSLRISKQAKRFEHMADQINAAL